MLLENQAVGHTTVSQSSNCTRHIVSNYLLNSQVGSYPPGFPYPGTDGKGSSAVASTRHRVRSGFERFLPRKWHCNQHPPVPLAQVKGKWSNLDSTVHTDSSANPDARVIKRNGLFRCSSRFLFTLLIISLRGPLSPAPLRSFNLENPILRYLIADNTCKDFYLSTDVRPCARENKKHLRGGFCNGDQIPDMNGSPVKFEAARCRVADRSTCGLLRINLFSR